jgi:hypothetical protein
MGLRRKEEKKREGKEKEKEGGEEERKEKVQIEIPKENLKLQTNKQQTNQAAAAFFLKKNVF